MPRRTKILATVGPASHDKATIRALIEAGVDAFRLNFSYGNHDEHARAAEMIREASRQLGRPVAILQDLQGPKIRVGRLTDGPRELTAGTEVTIVTRATTGDRTHIPIRFERLPQEVRAGDRIFLGDGEVELKVVSTGDGEIVAQVVEGGTLKENLGVHVPGARLDIAAVTEKDVADLKFGLQLGVDYLALSFVRGAEDVQQLKGMLKEQGVRLPVIAKLEKQEAIENLEEIMAVADGVMVARGDLALEVSPEQVPLLQKQIIRRANERGIPAITATQMLESMVNSPRPTRAEASDVANAILDGTDALMLSAETAAGRYPVRAVRMMVRIARAAEAEPTRARRERDPPAHGQGKRHRPGRRHAHAMSLAACALAKDVDAAAIVVFTRSGYSAQLVSGERPQVPIFAFTPSEEVWRQLALQWGVAPILFEFPPTAEEMIARAEGYLLERGLLKGGETVIVARWSRLRASGWTNFVKIHRLSTGG